MQSGCFVGPRAKGMGIFRRSCLIANGRHLRHHSSAFLGINYCALIAALGRALSASLSLLFSGDSPRRAYGPRLPWFLFLAFASLVATGFKPCASPRCQCSLTDFPVISKPLYSHVPQHVVAVAEPFAILLRCRFVHSNLS